MVLAIDVDYRENNTAKVSGVMFASFRAAKPIAVFSSHIDNVKPYKSGSFYERELPCILKLFEDYQLDNIRHILIDGYYSLEGHKALGKALEEKLKDRGPEEKYIYGIAKNKHKHDNNSIEIFRGESKKPLYLTANSKFSWNQFEDDVKYMHGQYRIPTMLKLVDQECRKK